MNITYDKKRQLFDFDLEQDEDHFAMTTSELLDLIQAYQPEAIAEWLE